MSCTEIARRIGKISARAVQRRIDRLVKSGVISISAIVNPKAVGFPVIADVWMEIEPGRILEVARELVKFEQISYVACSTGDRDLSVQVCARDNEELYRFVADVIGNVPGVRKTSTMLVPLILKDIYNWEIPRSVCAGEAENDEDGHRR